MVKRGTATAPSLVVVNPGREELTEMFLEGGESLTIILLPTGGILRRELTVFLRGDHSRLEILGLVLGRGEVALEWKVKVVHQGCSTNAYTGVRGVLFDQSRFDFFGMVKIEKEASKTVSLLENRLLVLGEKTRTQILPAFEIENGNVQASHIATVGQVEENALFYLQSRGIERNQAVQMLVEGFLQPVLARVKDREALKKMRRYLWQSSFDPRRQLK